MPEPGTPTTRPASSRRRVVVIGGGPAGLMAAIRAAMQHAQVVLLEQQPEPGRKLMATGGGRCNIANTAPPEEFMAAFGRTGRHMQSALEAFGLSELRSFLASVGIELVSPDGVHVYPRSGSAREVRDALRNHALCLGVVLRTGTAAAGLERTQEGGWRIRCAPDGGCEADAVVLATGGVAMPKLGATGSGYDLARSVGHTVKPPVPALVPLLTQDAAAHALAGVSLPDVELRAEVKSLRHERWRGPLLFTHRGLSGPAVLNFSGAIAEALSSTASPVVLRVNLVADRSAGDWRQAAAAWRERHGTRMLPSLLAGILPASVAGWLAQRTGIGTLPCAHWTREHHAALSEQLSDCPFEISGTEGFAAAMATRGGVTLREVSPATQESRLAPGLYLAGEILDLVGPCGGYNLLWAFSSGSLAGCNAGAPDT